MYMCMMYLQDLVYGRKKEALTKSTIVLSILKIQMNSWLLELNILNSGISMKKTAKKDCLERLETQLVSQVAFMMMKELLSVEDAMEKFTNGKEDN